MKLFDFLIATIKPIFWLLSIKKLYFWNKLQTLVGQKILRLAREGLAVLIGQCLGFAGLILLLRELTTYLTPADYGLFAIGLTITNLSSQVLMCINAGFARFFSIAFERNSCLDYFTAVKKLLFQASLLTIAVTVCFSVTCLILGKSSLALFGLALSLYSIFSGCSTAFGTILNAARQRNSYALSLAVDPWLKIISAKAIFSFFDRTALTAAISFAMGSLILSLFLDRRLYRYIYKINNDKSIKEHDMWKYQIVQYSRPFAASGTFMWIQQSSDKWSLVFFSGTYETGIYSALLQISYSPMVMLGGLVNNLISPIAFQDFERSRQAQIKSPRNIVQLSMIQMMIFTLICAAFAIVFQKQVVALTLGAGFRPPLYSLFTLILSGGVFAVAQIASLKYLVHMKTRRLSIIRICNCLLGTLLYVVGASNSGIMGVSMAGLLFSLSYLFLIIFDDFLYVLKSRHQGSG